MTSAAVVSHLSVENESPTLPGHTRDTVGHVAPTRRVRPLIPRTQPVAQQQIPYWERRLRDAFDFYRAAKTELELARGELGIVRDVARGEYDQVDEHPEYAVGSNGPWCLG